jgi:hypothetical protein
MSQSVQPVHRSQVEKLPMLVRQAQIEKKVENKSAMRKTAASKIYYTTPAGTFWGGFDPITGSGFYHSTLMIPPYTELTFVNKSAKADKWEVNGEDVTDSKNVVDGNYTTTSFRTFGEYATYAPTVTDGKMNNYTFGELNWIEKRGYMTSTWTKGLVRTDSLTGLWPSDPRAAIEYNGNWYSPTQSWGALDSDNLFGSGNYVDEEGSFKAVGTMEYFDKPISPLFITSAYVSGVTPMTTTAVIPEGKQLRLVLTRLKEVTDEETGEAYTTYDIDNIIATMYCNSGDTIGFSDTDAAGTRNQVEMKSGTLVFRVPGEEDAIGNIIPKNIVIDEPFCMLLLGFEQEGVNCGLYGNEVLDEDENCYSARILFENPNGGRYYSLGYNGKISLDFCFYGMFDKVTTVEELPYYSFEDESLDYNVVRVPVEGSTESDYGNMTEGANGSPFLGQENTNGYPGVPVLTNVYWFDEENEVANYDVIGLPEWIDYVSIYTGDYEDGGMNIVMFKAQPLPEGVKGRTATVYVVGQEVNMDDETKYSAKSLPITIIQGDADPDGIQDAVATRSNGTTRYNLAGQKVNNGFKGMIVKEGRKFIHK